jgi:MFS family permease
MARPRIVLWFLAAAGIFFTRALLFSTWFSRGPEVQQALSLNTAQMGLFVMLFPLGGLAGILFANTLTVRFGSKIVGSAIFLVVAAALATLGFSLVQGNLLLSSLALFAMGLPMAIADFLGNFEGTAVDRESKKSLFPAIHGAWGVGMLLGAAGASFAIDAGWSLTPNYLIVAGIVAVVSVWASLQFPTRDTPMRAPRGHERRLSLAVWKEKKNTTHRHHRFLFHHGGDLCWNLGSHRLDDFRLFWFCSSLCFWDFLDCHHGWSHCRWFPG